MSWSKMTQCLTLNLLTTTIVAPPSNASKWQMGFNSAFKRLSSSGCLQRTGSLTIFCKSGQQYRSLTVVPIVTGWSITNPFQLKNMKCMTFRAP